MTRSTPTSEGAVRNSKPPQVAPASFRSLASGFGLTLSGGAADAFLTFTFTVLLAHLLNASALGVFVGILAVFTLAAGVLQFGASATIVRVIGSYRATGRFADIFPAARLMLAASVGGALVVASAVFVAAPAVAGVLIHHGSQHTAELYLRILSPFLPLAALAPIVLAVTRAFGDMRWTVALDRVGEPLFRVCAASLGLAVAVATPIIMGLWALPIAVTCVVGCLASLRLIRGASQHPMQPVPATPRAPLRREVWRLTAPQWLADVFQMGVLWLDVVLLGALASSREVGIYSSVSRLVSVGLLALAALTAVLGPELSVLLASGQFERVRRVYSVSTVGMTAISTPVLLTMAVFAPLLVRIFGAAFAPGATALSILSIAMACDVVSGPALLALLMGARTGAILILSAGALILNLGANVILIPYAGMTGAACAWAVSILFLNGSALLIIRRLWGIQPFGVHFLSVLLLSLLWYGVVGYVSATFGGQTASVLLVSLAIGSAGYLTSLIVVSRRFGAFANFSSLWGRRRVPARSVLFAAALRVDPESGATTAAVPRTLRQKAVSIKRVLRTRAWSRPDMRASVTHGVYAENMVPFANVIDEVSELSDFLSPAEFFSRLEGCESAEAIRRPALLMTFDDGLLSSYEFIRDELTPRNIRVIFFVPTVVFEIGVDEQRALAVHARRLDPCTLREEQYRTVGAAEIRELVRVGHSVMPHSHTHARLSSLADADELENEVVKPRKILERLTGRSGDAFAFPYGGPNALSGEAYWWIRNTYSYCFTAIGGVVRRTSNPLLLRRIGLDQSIDVSTARTALGGAFDRSDGLKALVLNARLTSSPQWTKRDGSSFAFGAPVGEDG